MIDKDAILAAAQVYQDSEEEARIARTYYRDISAREKDAYSNMQDKEFTAKYALANLRSAVMGELA